MFNECFEWINYYFDNNIYYIFILLFDSNNKRIFTYIIKIELLCKYLCYHISNPNLKQVIILLKSIFEQIYFN